MRIWEVVKCTDKPICAKNPSGLTFKCSVTACRLDARGEQRGPREGSVLKHFVTEENGSFIVQSYASV